ncbi:hypothetical protein U4E84_06810 [Halorubrum sp. AD140]|nr:hypothetical protein [Halorubrum sp. AD140]MDZ5811053.1 hypothetical protein [Halorubrum sp. AD140]
MYESTALVRLVARRSARLSSFDVVDETEGGVRAAEPSAGTLAVTGLR